MTVTSLLDRQLPESCLRAIPVRDARLVGHKTASHRVEDRRGLAQVRDSLLSG
ncbi:hypothetical protein [Alcaligenes phenolicus]